MLSRVFSFSHVCQLFSHRKCGLLCDQKGDQSRSIDPEKDTKETSKATEELSDGVVYSLYQNPILADLVGDSVGKLVLVGDNARRQILKRKNSFRLNVRACERESECRLHLLDVLKSDLFDFVCATAGAESGPVDFGELLKALT